jgi:hypothetical protein
MNPPTKSTPAISSRGNQPGEHVMSINCDVILRGNATPEQLTAVGSALWRWCNREAGGAGIYQYLDSQPLADLIAGRHPAPDQAPRQAGRQGIRFKVRDAGSEGLRTMIDGLRREIPAGGVEDIVVAGTSWNPPGSQGQTGGTP